MWFRGMRPETNGFPTIARSARALGVRVPEDIAPDDAGCVGPGYGGMSVSPDSIWNVPNHRRPQGMGRGSTGPPGDHIYGIDGAPVAEVGLLIRPDSSHPERHAFVEAAEVMLLVRYEAALAETRPHWRRTWP
jgi:hypothetical protein